MVGDHAGGRRQRMAWNPCACMLTLISANTHAHTHAPTHTPYTYPHPALEAHAPVLSILLLVFMLSPKSLKAGSLEPISPDTTSPAELWQSRGRIEAGLWQV